MQRLGVAATKGYLGTLVAAAAVLSTVGPRCDASPIRRSLNRHIRHFEPLHIPRNRIRRGVHDARPSGGFELPIDAFNMTMLLKLEPATHLFQEDAFVHDVGADTIEPLTHHGFYTGRVHGWRKSFAHVAVDREGRVNAMVDAGGTEAWHIEPASVHFDAPQEFEHVIYRESDWEHKKGPDTRPDCDEMTARIPKEAVFVDQPTFGQSQFGAARQQLQARSRRQTLISASAYVLGQDICNIALYGDQTFIKEFSKVGSSTVVTMVARFSKAVDVMTATYLNQNGVPLRAKLRIARVALDNVSAVPHTNTAASYLEGFSKANTEGTRIWTDVCLAQAYTHSDFGGTLGLAWTAYPASTNHNGGICQAAYINVAGESVSLNTGFHTSFNYGDRQPELLTSLVLAHEIGHNFGAPHDTLADLSSTDAGNYLMYKYAVSGAQSNNARFSSDSVASINAAMTDRAGCFLPSSGANTPDPCGNFIREGNEQCDCGGDAATCAIWDKCCDPTCRFSTNMSNTNATNVTAECAPTDHEHGVCCTSDCTRRNTSFVCAEQSECTAEAKCTANGECNVVQRSDYALCQKGVTACAVGGCSNACFNGACTLSICELWNLTRCTGSQYSGVGACEVKCLTDSGACIAPANLGALARNVTVYGPTNLVANASDFAVRYQSPGSPCELEAGVPSSGTCQTDGTCTTAATEDEELEDLFGQYGYLRGNFADWAEEDESGAPRYVWLIIGATFTLFICCGLCYAGNNPKWIDNLDWFCHHYCMCCHKEIEPWDPVKNRQRRELAKKGTHGVRKKKLPPATARGSHAPVIRKDSVDESDA